MIPAKQPTMRNNQAMSILCKILFFVWVLGFMVIGTFLPFARAQDQVAADAAKGRVLTAKEINAIYEDRTWLWGDGAAYFRTNKEFFAWFGKDEKASYAEGSWSTNDQGLLCFHATWYGLEGHSASSSCFEHRTDDKNIFQRKTPDGGWYIFSHLPQVPGDLIEKVQNGDRLSDDFQKTKRYLADYRKQIIANAPKSPALFAKELRSIYADRTWSWDGGAFYFRSKNEDFRGWVGKNANAHYAEGSWSVSDHGRLCVHATWYDRKGHGPATTCFEHHADGRNIYRRKLPDGEWSVVGHLPRQPGDEIDNLQTGDRVSEGYQANKRYIAAQSDWRHHH
jgi:hypothetical protein